MYVTCMRDFMYGLGKRLDLINDDDDDDDDEWKF